MGSPPPEGSKNEVFKLRSVNNIVIAPAKTGTANNNKIVVILIDQVNKVNCSNFLLIFFILIIVVIKLIAPIIDDIPARCKEKIDKSTDIPSWLIFKDKGG